MAAPRTATHFRWKPHVAIIDHWPLLIPLTLFLLFQLALILSTSIVEYDEAIFMNVARSLRRVGQPLRPMGSEGVFFFEHTPLYLYLLTGFTYLFGENILLLRSTTVLFAIGTILLIYHMVRSARGPLSGLIAALLLALNPFFGLYSYFIRMEVPMCFFILLSIYFVVRAENDGEQKYLLAAGLAAAIAVLIEQFALFYWAALLLYWLLNAQPWRKTAVSVLWTTVPTIIGLGLWALWAYTLSPLQFQGTLNRWLGSAIGSNQIADSRMTVALQAWLQEISTAVFPWGMVAFLLIGLLLAVQRHGQPPRYIRLAWLYLLLTIVTSFVISLKEPRHIIGTIPVLALAIGLLLDWDQLVQQLRQKPAWLAAFGLLCLFFLWQIAPLKLPPRANWQQFERWWEPQFAYRMFHSDRHYGIIEKTGRYIAGQVAAQETLLIIHEGPVVSFYADRPYHFLFTRSLDDIVARLDDTQHLIFDENVFIRLSDEEKTSVMAYIAEHFSETAVVEDAYRQVIIYQRH